MAALKVSLDGVSLFADLSDKKRESLVPMCTIRRYAAGDVVVPAGAGPNGEVAFVLSGGVRVGAALGDHGRIEFEDLGPGDHYGALSALDARVPLGSVIARQDSVLAILPAAEFVRTLSQNGKVALALLRETTARLLAASARSDAQGDGNHIQRVFGELLRLAEPSPAGDGSWIVNPMPKHRELADRADTSEESAASAIAHLIRVGLARRRFPALEIVDRAQMRALCDLR